MDAKNTTIAERLTSAMKEAGDISDSELARACGVSPTSVYKWKHGGKLSADSLAAAARSLGVREEWLRTGKLPREREGGNVEYGVDQVLDILDDLREPLSALAAAIDQLSKTRPERGKRRRA